VKTIKDEITVNLFCNNLGYFKLLFITNKKSNPIGSVLFNLRLYFPGIAPLLTNTFGQSQAVVYNKVSQFSELHPHFCFKYTSYILISSFKERNMDTFPKLLPFYWLESRIVTSLKLKIQNL